MCVRCGVPIDERRTYCPPCRRASTLEAKRRHQARYMRTDAYFTVRHAWYDKNREDQNRKRRELIRARGNKVGYCLVRFAECETWGCTTVIQTAGAMARKRFCRTCAEAFYGKAYAQQRAA